MKVGSRAVQTKSITISVTVTANAATAALNSAGFTGVLFSVETANASINRGRIKCAPTAAGTVVQILWRLGWALGFEDCKYKQGRGYYYDGGFGGDLKNATPTTNKNAARRELILLQNKNRELKEMNLTAANTVE